jgi:S-DNA-T family DNA segregation ATPase FtsK/SpoIIIE
VSTTWETVSVSSPAEVETTTGREAGVIESKPDTTLEKAAPARTGSAAMVVARAAGRGAGHFASGIALAGRKWAEAYHDDYPHMIRLAKGELKASEDTRDAAAAKANVKQWRADHRRHRLQHLGKTSVGTLMTGGGLAAGGLILGGWVDIVLALTGAGAATWHGRRVSREALAALGPVLDASVGPAQLGPSELGMTVDQLPEGKPFVVAAASTPHLLAVCVLRALLAEGVPVAEVYGIVRFDWGWQCVVRVSEGTPEAIIAKAGPLETRFDLPTGGLRPQPMVERRACAVLRLVTGDPFASAPGLVYRAPKSVSITSAARFGTATGGGPLEMSLAGVMGEVIAASGGGKTGILQALGEFTTACYDNVTIDIDPHGDGLEDLYDGVRLTARTTEQIEAVLLFFLMFSKGRARLRKKLGMGRDWKISADRPHVTITEDEFPKLSDLAKKLAFELLNVGRKEAVTKLIASQGASTLYLGQNIAQMIALKMVGPCKVGDTRAVFGDGAVSEGWLPHRLAPATKTDPKDAGHVFVQGVPGMADEPIEYKVHEIAPATLRQLAAERKAAGLVELDQESLDAMREVDLPDYVLPTYDAEGNLKKEAPVELLTWEQLLRLCEAEPPASAVPSLARTVLADAVGLMNKFGVDRMRKEALVAALADHDPGAYGDLTVESLRDLLVEAGAGKPVTLGNVDGIINPRGYKRDTLADCL